MRSKALRESVAVGRHATTQGHEERVGAPSIDNNQQAVEHGIGQAPTL